MDGREAAGNGRTMVVTVVDPRGRPLRLEAMAVRIADVCYRIRWKSCRTTHAMARHGACITRITLYSVIQRADGPATRDRTLPGTLRLATAGNGEIMADFRVEGQDTEMAPNAVIRSLVLTRADGTRLVDIPHGDEGHPGIMTRPMTPRVVDGPNAMDQLSKLVGMALADHAEYPWAKALPAERFVAGYLLQHGAAIDANHDGMSVLPPAEWMPLYGTEQERRREMHKHDTPTISVNDVLDKYRRYDASEEAKEPILYFISELTGLSVDALLEIL